MRGIGGVLCRPVQVFLALTWSVSTPVCLYDKYMQHVLFKETSALVYFDVLRAYSVCLVTSVLMRWKLNLRSWRSEAIWGETNGQT